MVVRDIVSGVVRGVVRDVSRPGVLTKIPEWMKLGWNLFQPDPIVGPEPVFSVASANYDEAGNSIGLNPRVDAGKGLWMGGQVAQLFTGDSSQARSVTLTAQAYTLFVWSGSASCSYGTATPGNPLKFTATAGTIVFTPIGVSKWLLVAGAFGAMPYVPPGSVQPTNSATTGGNGTNIPLDAGLLKCFGDGVVPAVCTVMAEHYMGVGSADIDTLFKNVFSCGNTDSIPFFFTNTYIVRGYDGSTAVSSTSGWSPNEIHRRYVQTSSDGTKFRVGYQSFSSAMVEITSGIQWSHPGAESPWATFDGSFNPLTYLRMCLNVTVPIWGRKIVIANKSLSAAEISDAWGLVA